jgi:hypothetical protein
MDGVSRHDRGRENQVRHAWATSRCTEPTRPRPGQALSDHHTVPTHIFEAWIAIYVRQKKFTSTCKGAGRVCPCTWRKIHQVRHTWATSRCTEPTRPRPGQALGKHHTVPTHVFEAWIAIYVRQKNSLPLAKGLKGGCTWQKIHQVRHAWATSRCPKPTGPRPGQALSDHHTVPTHIFEAWIAIYVRQTHKSVLRKWPKVAGVHVKPSRLPVNELNRSPFTRWVKVE